jgi:hypothetical protein
VEVPPIAYEGLSRGVDGRLIGHLNGRVVARDPIGLPIDIAMINGPYRAYLGRHGSPFIVLSIGTSGK